MGRKWIVEIEGKDHEVEARYGDASASGSGEVLVDGKLVDVWGASYQLPEVRSFAVAGKQATLRRKGVKAQNLELSVSEATRVTRVKRGMKKPWDVLSPYKIILGQRAKK
jgi:hypothetical protein